MHWRHLRIGKVNGFANSTYGGEGTSQSTNGFRIRVAEVWHRIVRTAPTDFLDDRQLSYLLRRPHTRDDLAQPGFVGRNYGPGGLLFVSMNPGNGGNGNTGGDLQQYDALDALKYSSEENVSPAFERLTDVLAQFMPTWEITRNIVSRVLALSRFELSDVAYIDLFKWRTMKRADLNHLYRSAWANHVREQISVLQPKLVVALGASVRNSLIQVGYSDTTLSTVRRHFSRLRPNNGEGEWDIATIETWLKDHSLFRFKADKSDFVPDH